ncbi:MAG: glucose 1-dehydrogenase [Aeromicrobium erythreum]
MNVQDKSVVITGAAQGIGRASARTLAAAGARIVVTDVDEVGGSETVELIEKDGGRAVFVAHDVTDPDQWDEVVRVAQQELGRIDALVNNAGIYIISALADIELSTWNRLMDVNVTGTFLGMKHVAPSIAESGGGSIVNLSSVAGLQGSAGHTLYCASKGAVRLMSKAAAAELAEQDVRVNSLHPGYVTTAMADYGAEVAERSIEELGGTLTRLGRLASVEDVAGAVLYLVSDEARYMTGSELVIDGGMTSSVAV